jgi:hypothetical protein
VRATGSIIGSATLLPLFHGSIFLCYSDYRTHVGDRGVGALKQRVHGVVDIYGRPSSYEVMRLESGPIELLSVENQLNVFHLLVRTRRDMTMYTLRCLSFRQGFFISRYVGTDRMRESATLSITRQR